MCAAFSRHFSNTLEAIDRLSFCCICLVYFDFYTCLGSASYKELFIFFKSGFLTWNLPFFTSPKITKIHHLSCCFGGFCHSPLADLSRPLSLSLSYKHPSFSPKFCGLSALFTSAVLTLPTFILLTEDWGSMKRITIMSLRTPGLPPPINKWGSNTQSETGNGICALPLKWF